MKKEEPKKEQKCPFCGRKKTVQEQANNIYFCSYCVKLFDPRQD